MRLQFAHDVRWQLPRHRNGIHPGNTLIHTLPAPNPGVLRLEKGKYSTKVGTSALEDGFNIRPEMQEVIAVLTAVHFELFERLDQRAQQTGSQFACLVGNHVVQSLQVFQVIHLVTNRRKECRAIGQSMDTIQIYLKCEGH